MAIGADNCWQIINKLPRMNCTASPRNIMLSSGPQVNYFPSFQTLSAIRHADSSAKFIMCLTASSTPVTVNSSSENRSTKLKKLSVQRSVYFVAYLMKFYQQHRLWCHIQSSRNTHLLAVNELMETGCEYVNICMIHTAKESGFCSMSSRFHFISRVLVTVLQNVKKHEEHDTYIYCFIVNKFPQDHWARSSACAAQQYCGSVSCPHMYVWRNAIHHMHKWHHTKIQVLLAHCWVMMTYYETQQYKNVTSGVFSKSASSAWRLYKSTDCSTQSWNPVPGGITGPPCSWGI
jgi:hypothetical protein